jgi:RNA polymerase sigma factor (sigma-70 family)
MRSAANVSDDSTLASLVTKAQAGDASALEAIVAALRHDIFRLALRMTAHWQDAEDATQEILIKVVTSLSGFRGNSSIRTWAYRIAVRHLLDRRKSRLEAQSLTFQEFGADLLDGLAANPEPDPVLAEEVKLGCTLAMLTCLDREHRVAFVLTDVFDLPHAEAAVLCGLSEDVYRQRVSRARRALEAFTRAYCGLVNERAACRCDRRVARAAELGRLHRSKPVLVNLQREALPKAVQEMQSLHNTAELMRRHPAYLAPVDLLERVKIAIGCSKNTVCQPVGYPHT